MTCPHGSLRLKIYTNQGKILHRFPVLLGRFPAGHGTDNTQGFIVKLLIYSLTQTRTTDGSVFINNNTDNHTPHATFTLHRIGYLNVLSDPLFFVTWEHWFLLLRQLIVMVYRMTRFVKPKSASLYLISAQMLNFLSMALQSLV